MNNINQIVIEGNITRIPDFKTTPHGSPICKLPIAVNHYYKKSGSNEYISEVSYFDVETFGKLAEICAKYSQKGRGVNVVGRIKQNRWKSEDGKNMSRVSIIAEKVVFKPKFQAAKDSESEAVCEVTEEFTAGPDSQPDLTMEAQAENPAVTENQEETVF